MTKSISPSICATGYLNVNSHVQNSQWLPEEGKTSKTWSEINFNFYLHMRKNILKLSLIVWKTIVWNFNQVKRLILCANSLFLIIYSFSKLFGFLIRLIIMKKLNFLLLVNWTINYPFFRFLENFFWIFALANYYLFLGVPGIANVDIRCLEHSSTSLV